MMLVTNFLCWQSCRYAGMQVQVCCQGEIDTAVKLQLNRLQTCQLFPQHSLLSVWLESRVTPHHHTTHHTHLTSPPHHTTTTPHHTPHHTTHHHHQTPHSPHHCVTCCCGAPARGAVVPVWFTKMLLKCDTKLGRGEYHRKIFQSRLKHGDKVDSEDTENYEVNNNTEDIMAMG